MDKSPLSLANVDGVVAALTNRYVVATNGTISIFSSITAFDLATGEQLWETPDESSNVGFPQAIQGGFAFGYSLRDDGTPPSTSDPFALQGRDARTGELRWTIDSNLPVASSPDRESLLALRTDPDASPQARIVSTANGTLSPRFVTSANLDIVSFVIDSEWVYLIDDDYALVAYELSAFFDD
jgi:outer membrane protein assembly factor BamB